MSITKYTWFKWTLLALVVLPSLIYMGARIVREDSWDNWDFGSAQTMLTARYWGRDGFIPHKLLFLPAGYHPEIKVLDQPEFQFLANGLVTGGLIGRRVHYTHYPSLYLAPYGLLAKLGIESRFWFRMLALFFSFGSVALMAAFLYLVTKRNIWAVALAVLYYVTSVNFLSYADSLANIPIDDFFKWGILFSSFYFFNAAAEEKNKKIGKIFIWILYFILSASSYDSTFLIFIWLCALDFFQDGRVRFKKYLAWSLAPISAFILQMGQNVWYLGLKDAALDAWGAFLFRFSVTPQVSEGLNALPFGIKNIVLSLSTISYFSDLKTRFALPLILLLAYLCFRQKFVEKDIARYIAALAVGGLLYPFFLPSVVAFGYQGRQVAPALLLLFSLAAWKVILSIRERNAGKHTLLVLGCVLIFVAAHGRGVFAYAQKWPNNIVEKEKIEYWRQLGRLTDTRTMIIGTPEAMRIGSSRFFQEYYSDRLELAFKDADTLVEYIDKIYSALPSKVNFLVEITDSEYAPALKKLQSMKEYMVTPQAVAGMPEGLALISVAHK